MLGAAELHATRVKLIRVTQHTFFSSEVSRLRKGLAVARGSPLLPLQPFLDENGLMRTSSVLDIATGGKPTNNTAVRLLARGTSRAACAPTDSARRCAVDLDDASIGVLDSGGEKLDAGPDIPLCDLCASPGDTHAAAYGAPTFRARHSRPLQRVGSIAPHSRQGEQRTRTQELQGVHRFRLYGHPGH